MKTILVSFADWHYRKALERLEEYTRAFPFDERHLHTERNTFDRAYWRGLKPWLYRRGFGYWEWKGRLVEQYLRGLDEGDVLVWSDAGVYWNASPAALERFSQYISMLGGGVRASSPSKSLTWKKNGRRATCSMPSAPTAMPA